jgi:hypothetical protein
MRNLQRAPVLSIIWKHRMDTALVGLVGLLVGMLITEHFRKRSRIEQFSGRIFEKRLTVYEKLMEEFILSCGVIDALYEDEKMPLVVVN